MHTNCVKCGAPDTNDSLSPEGECFSCSAKMPDDIDMNKCIKETMSNVVSTLALRTGELKAGVRKKMLAAAKDKRSNVGCN